MGINKSTAKKLQYRRVFWPGNIKSTGTVNRQLRVAQYLTQLGQKTGSVKQKSQLAGFSVRVQVVKAKPWFQVIYTAFEHTYAFLGVVAKIRIYWPQLKAEY